MRSIDPAILFVRPQSISADDKARLERAGVIVVHVDDPQAVKLVRASAELPGSELLSIAAKAIAEQGVAGTREAFGRMVCDAIQKRIQD